jgi:hypothetical protein
MDSDKEFIRAVQTAVTKGILYICLAVTAAFWFSSCQLDAETIQQCQDSCDSTTTHMKSVTSRECECISKEGEEIWALPK